MLLALSCGGDEETAPDPAATPRAIPMTSPVPSGPTRGAPATPQPPSTGPSPAPATVIPAPAPATELAARIRAALRKRLEPEQDEPSAPYAAGELRIDYARRRATLAGEPLELTATEYAVLYELAVRAPRVLSHGLLLQRVWGPERVGEPWAIRDVVKRLRRKLGDDASQPAYLFTERRVGYRLAAPEPPRAEPVPGDAPDGGE